MAKSASDSDSDGGGNGSCTNTPTSKSTAPVTPKMRRFFGFLSNAAIVSSFFGSISLLDEQDVFDNTFGLTPLILYIQPMKFTPVEYFSRVRTYAEKCMLDIFLKICREDYVGSDDAGSKSKLVHEVYKKIGIIKISSADTPEEIYTKYISMVAGIPNDASLWSIILCASYYSALSNNLKEKMEELIFACLSLII